MGTSMTPWDMTLWSPAAQQVALAAKDEQARVSAIETAWAMYEGRHPKQLVVREGKPDDNVVVNVCRALVDKGVSFLVGEDVSIAAPDGDEQSEAKDAALARLFSPWVNRRKSWLHRLAMTGSVAGHLVAKINSRPDAPAGSPPKLAIIDPKLLRVHADGADYEDIQEYVIQWTHVDGRTLRAEARRQRIIRMLNAWLVVDERSRDDIPRWELIGRVDWPWPWPPIVCAQNLPMPGVWWGQPDLTEDVIAQNIAVNRVLSNTGRIIRFHAHPKTWAKGTDVGQLDASIDGVWDLGDPEAEVGVIEMRGDLASSIAVYERLKSALHEVARVPEIAVGRLDNVGDLSGLALRILYGPLLEKTATKQMLMGELLMDLAGRCLAVMGFQPDRDAPLPVVEVTWPDPLPSDPLGDAEIARARQDAGVSKRTTLTEMGYDPDAEQEAREGEAPAGPDPSEFLPPAFNQQ